MIQGLLVKALFNYLRRNGGTLGLIAIIVTQGYIGRIQTQGLERRIKEGQQREEKLKEALAIANQAIVRLDEKAKSLPPGKTETVLIRVPEYIGYEKPVPILVTRAEKTIETKIETVALPPEKIKEIIDKSPQSLVFEIEATRDIAKGEKFKIVASQVAPGVWQPILEIGAPIKVDAKTVTPIDKIPQPQTVASPRRFHVTLYAGYSLLDAGVLGIRPSYVFSRTFGIEGQVECRGVQLQKPVCARGTDLRLVGTVTW